MVRVLYLVYLVTTLAFANGANGQRISIEEFLAKYNSSSRPPLDSAPNMKNVFVEKEAADPPLTEEEIAAAMESDTVVIDWDEDEGRPLPGKPRNSRRSWHDVGVRKWPDNTIPYMFGSTFTTSQRNEIAAAIGSINAETCINIVPYVQSQHSSIGYVEIMADNPNSCHVYDIGWSGAKVYPMNLGKVYANGFCLLRSSVMHEFYHIIGTEHEQNRPDRDDHIDVHWDCLVNDFGTYFQFLRNCATEGETQPVCTHVDLGTPSNNGLCCYDFTTTGGFPYDPSSIMHYGNTAGSISYTCPAMTLKSNPNAALGGEVLTSIDIAEANHFSSCEDGGGGEEPTTPTPPREIPIQPPGNSVVWLNNVHCDSDGYCDCRYFQSPQGRHRRGSRKWDFRRLSAAAASCPRFEVFFTDEFSIYGLPRASGVGCNQDYLNFYSGGPSNTHFATYCGHCERPSGWNVNSNRFRVLYYTRRTRNYNNFKALVCLRCQN